MKAIRLMTLALAVLGAALLANGHRIALADGEYGTLYIDVLPDASNTTTSFGAIEVCRDTDDLGGPLDVGDTFTIDIVIAGAPDIKGVLHQLNYDPAVLKVTAYDWQNWKLGAGGVNISDPMPDTDGIFTTSYANLAAVSGGGVVQRITLEAVGNGTSDLTFTDAQVTDEFGVGHYPPEVLVDDPPGDVRAVVNSFCLAPTPTLPPAVGGIAVLPDVPASSAPNYIALAGLGAGALVVVSAGAWYARRRLLR